MILTQIFKLSTGRNPDKPFITDKALGNCQQVEKIVYCLLPVTERAACNKWSLKHHLSVDGDTRVSSLTWDAGFRPVLVSHLVTLILFTGSIRNHLPDLLTLYFPAYTQLIPWPLMPGLISLAHGQSLATCWKTEVRPEHSERWGR